MTTSPERRYTDRLEEFADRHPFLVDLALIAVLMGSATLGASLTLPNAETPGDDRTAVLLLGVSCLALFLHRSHPRVTVVVNAACATVVIAQGYLLTPLLLAPVMASLYLLATRTERETIRSYGIATMAALTIAAAVSDSMDHLSLLLRTIGPFFWLLLPLAAGTMTRLRRAYLEATQARAEHAERTREEEARLRVTEERMRIARELHDVVAHHLALANAQAGTAEHLALVNPPQTKQILHDLTGTTSSALRELKATLGLLRQTGDVGSTPPEPAPGLARLPELVSSCASAGITVTVATEGEPQSLSPGVDLTAFRIVQEALTNVTKHAVTQTAHVRFVYSGTRLLITVTDEGPPTAAASEPVKGFGVMGMRERAHSIGGELQAGPRPEGGFEVSTALPLRPSVSGEQTA
ncbi:sensor histidine kinase [Streptomyces canus]|uniref:sensor histidine kinase n=1 Tax=Streptomyces canus TaxID=58343 RepID=UPI0033A26E03